MDRITGATVDIGSGRRGFRDRNLGLNLAGTIPGATWFNGAQEEIVRAIETLGLTPSDANREQLIQAMRRLAGGFVRTISTGGVTLTADDAGLVLVNASGSFGLTLPAANAAGGLPQRLTFARTDSSAGVVTIQRAGSDTIEGATSIALLPAERLTLMSDGGTGWRVMAAGTGALINIQVFSASGTYTPTPGMQSCIVHAVGGGGGGGGMSNGSGQSSPAGGGSSGGYAVVRFSVAEVGGSRAVTIGAAGAGGAVGANNGGNGGTTSLGPLLTVPGGLGGAGSSGSAASVLRAGASPGAAPSNIGGTVLHLSPGQGGNPGIGTADGLLGGAGAHSPMTGGGGGPWSGVNSNGQPATAPGAGGGGACGGVSAGSLAGGAGAAGRIIILEYR